MTIGYSHIGDTKVPKQQTISSVYRRRSRLGRLIWAFITMASVALLFLVHDTSVPSGGNLSTKAVCIKPVFLNERNR